MRKLRITASGWGREKKSKKTQTHFEALLIQLKIRPHCRHKEEKK
jgi:hypothetical protein